MKKIIVFTTSDRPREYTSDIKNNLEQDLDAEVQIIDLDSLDFYVVNNEVQIRYQGSTLSDVSLCYIKHWHAHEEAALVVSSYFKMASTKVLPQETLRIVPKTKFGETFLLAMNGLPVPDSVYNFSNLKFLENYDSVVETLGLPFIFKAVDGKKGASNYLIRSIEDVENAIEESGDHTFIAQKFIDNDGDYRIINFGNELKIAIYRTRSGDTHLNNTSLGGGGELVNLDTLSDQVKQDSLAAAMLLGRDISGIDVVIGRDGRHYIFEINYSPQITTGTFLDVKRDNLSSYFGGLIS